MEHRHRQETQERELIARLVAALEGQGSPEEVADTLLEARAFLEEDDSHHGTV